MTAKKATKATRATKARGARPVKVHILWGDSLLDDGAQPETYVFESERDAAMFLQGVQAAFDSDADGFQLADHADDRWCQEQDEFRPASHWDAATGTFFPVCEECQEALVDEEGEMCDDCRALAE